MAAIVDQDKCQKNGKCLDVCPTGAIEIQDNGKAIIIPENCADCGACVEVCPVEAISME